MSEQKTEALVRPLSMALPTTISKLSLPLLGVWLLCPIASGQDAQTMISGGGKAVTLKAASLTGDYHAVEIKTAGTSGGGGLMDMLMSPMMMMMGALGAAAQGSDKNDQPPFGLMSAMNISWTTGETQIVFGQTYLVTYKLSPDFAKLAGMAPSSKDFTGLDLTLQFIRTDMIQTFTPRPDVTPETFLEMLKPPPAPKPAKAAPAKPGK